MNKEQSPIFIPTTTFRLKSFEDVELVLVLKSAASNSLSSSHKEGKGPQILACSFLCSVQEC